MSRRPSVGRPRVARLLLVSSRARNKAAIFGAVHPEIKVHEYQFESAMLEDIVDTLRKGLADRRVSSIAIVAHSSERELFLCAPGEAKLSRKSMVKDERIRSFFKVLVDEFIEDADRGARLDFLATYMAEQIEGGLLAKEMEELLGCEVGLSKNLEGHDIQVTRRDSHPGFLTVGEMYFDMPTLRHLLSQVGRVTKDGERKLDSYEKIRVVGTGAFGRAVLYRRLVDGLLSIIKEINLVEMNNEDRKMALNEVKVLATLDHPNIVGYYDSFEMNGILMIEMEYADGGTLADMLGKRKTRIDEKEILDIFSQIVSGIRYMHSKSVLHRDLKTANIFLTIEGLVKIGDFGISKVLSTQQAGAVTVLGTPYYISPEMCEGKVYDEKSDIWALGCIAYEMACLQKTFEASNLPALVNKIMRGQFEPIRGNYSPLFKQMVRDLLQKDPEFRPTASEVALQHLPELMALYEDSPFVPDYEDGLSDTEVAVDNPAPKRQSRPPRSVLFYLKGYESTITLTPCQLPPRARISQVSVSNTHIVALTSDLMVFTWGEGRRGQLGHGEVESWRSRPTCVESLKEMSITKVGAGDGFSVFASEKGMVMTCGDGSFGALGHGDWHSTAVPKIVQGLIEKDVKDIACGNEHVVVVGEKGDVYSWGRGSGGRLGLGNEEDWCTPKEVKLDRSIYIISVKCSSNATILLSDQGHLYACGGNRYNRLGLDESKGLFMTTHIDRALVPTRIRSIKQPIIDFSMGPNHTVCITIQGKLIAMGRNSEAQLGRGHARSCAGPDYVKALKDKEVALVSCGSTFTAAGTSENVIYFWGTRFISPVSRPNTRDAFNDSFGARLVTPSEEPLTEAEVRDMIQREREMGDGRQYANGQVVRDSQDDRSKNLIRHEGELIMKDVIIEPQEILALYASPSQLSKGETVTLNSIESQNQNIFLIVETTCPLAKCERPVSSGRSSLKEIEAPPILDMKDYEEDDVVDDDVPEWLKNDLQDAEDLRPPTRGDRGNAARKQQVAKVVNKNNAEYKKQLEREFHKKHIEIKMEAQNAVREREKALNEEVIKLREELHKRERERVDILANRADVDEKKNVHSNSTTCVLQ